MEIEALINKVRQEGRNLLLEQEAKVILEKTGISTTLCHIVSSPKQAQETAASLGFPVVLKVSSSILSHKSEVGGVKLDLKDGESVSKAYHDILAKAESHDSRAQVTVQKMAPPGVEIIAGVNQDPQFGPVIMFGMGGIWVEILKDVSFRIIPIEPRDARDMMSEIKGRPLIEGYRGNPPLDKDKIVQLLCSLSQMVMDYPLFQEVDLNPVLAYPDGIMVVDARMVIKAD